MDKNVSNLDSVDMNLKFKVCGNHNLILRYYGNGVSEISIDASFNVTQKKSLNHFQFQSYISFANTTEGLGRCVKMHHLGSTQT